MTAVVSISSHSGPLLGRGSSRRTVEEHTGADSVKLSRAEVEYRSSAEYQRKVITDNRRKVASDAKVGATD